MREEVEKDPDKDAPSRMLRGMRARDMATRFDDPKFVSHLFVSLNRSTSLIYHGFSICIEYTCG